MENKINYDLFTQKLIDEITAENKRKSLLLHVCCAPCSSYVLEYLNKFFNITVYFYNPNIDDADEYRYRADEEKRLLSEMPFDNPPVYSEGQYDVGEFYKRVSGLESLPEGGQRCVKCFELRLDSTAKRAKAENFDYFTTTLSISPMKNSKTLNDIGKSLSEKYGVNYLYSDFKKKNGYKRSIELSHEYGLYRQNYCGCSFSRNKALTPTEADE